MTEHGFEVIRFSEEQIFLNPEECSNIIRRYLESILSGHRPEIEGENIKVSKWTKEQASVWAYNRFRNSYVPENLCSAISHERQDSYERIRKLSDYE